MPYKFQPGMMYRMPTHFGPALGLRQSETGPSHAPDSRNITYWSVSFLTNREQLDQLLPEGFEVGAEPVVTVEAAYMTNIDWLAGRGYNTLGVSFPAVFNGEKDHVSGNFLTVKWESLCDPIITGREEIGFSKIYGELPPPKTYKGVTNCTASWLGFKFVDLTIKNLKQLSPEEVAELKSKRKSDGILHYKYIVKTGEWGEAEVAYATLTPPLKYVETREVWRGEGTVQFHKATWQDLPTQVRIVNGLQALEIKEYRGAMMVKTVGGDDLRSQRILR
ncbi:acetoacetate decarboxylase family protein [Chloroflexota bacterium]